MDLIHLYGPPASGKLTVAKALAERTGYGLFHNHLSIACVAPVFDFGTAPFWRVVRAIRDIALVEAAREERDLICTGVYSPDDDEALLHRFGAVENNGGRICLVQLYCPADTLFDRVDSADRRAAGKLTNGEDLRRALTEHELFSAIPGRHSLRVDTSRYIPAEAVDLIVGHYGLAAAGVTLG